MNEENPRTGNENHTDKSIASFLKRIWKDIQVFALDSKNEFITISQWQFLVSLIDNEAREWRDDEVALLQEITQRCWVRLERVYAEKALLESKERQGFLLSLSDVLRSLSDPVEILAVVARGAMDFFGADRCYFCEIEDDIAIIRKDAKRGDLSSIAGAYPLSSLPLHKALIDAGQPIIVPSVKTMEVADEELRQLCTQFQVISYINIPVIRDGRPVGLLCITQSTPRNWRDPEAELAVEIAERTLAAVERAKNEGKKKELLYQAIDEYENLNAIINSIDEEIWICDLAGNTTHLNPSAQMGIGIRVERKPILEIVSLLNFLEPDGSPRLPENAPLLRALKGETVSGEEIIQHLITGKQRYRQFNCAPIINRFGNITGAVGVAKDITEQKRAEQELKKSEARAYKAIAAERQRLYDVLERLPAMVCLLTPDYYIAFANQAFREKFGESHGRHCYEYCMGKPEPCDFCEAFRVLETGEPHQWEVITPNGRVIDVYDLPFTDVDGSPMVLEMNLDITERKRAEEALLYREEQLRLALSAGRLGTYSTDFLTGETVFNDEYFYMLGYEPGEIKPGFLNIVGRIHPEDRPIILMNHTQNMERGGEFSDEYRLLLPDGTVRWMKNRGFIENNEAGHPVHVYGVVIDTTEQKKAEMLLRKRKEQALKLVDTLRQVDQNKNAFINMLSHELRNPLASIMMSLDLLDKFPADEKMAGMAREIARRQGKQLTRLVDDLLDVTRINQNKVTLKKEWVELNELIKTVILDYQLQFAENMVKLEVNLTSPLYLEADSSRLTQVIGNLLHNAAKFTSKNDLVTVTVAPDMNTSEAIITVQDTGRGIEPNYLENLFEPFTQFEQSLDRSHGGLGLGLAVVKGMVELHGGSVEALSEGRDKGATFTIRLPLPKENLGEQEGYGSLEPILNESITVLLIDDNKDLARVICELIAFIGYKTEAAHNGTEGIAKARKLRPDVVICDIGLPGMSGYKVAQLLRKDPELQDIFLIALSGYAQPEDIERSKEAGFDRHLGKPVSIEMLQQVLNNLLIESNHHDRR